MRTLVKPPAWPLQLGQNIPFLEKCSDCIVGCYVSPELFDRAISTLQDVDTIRSFGKGFESALSEDQKKKFRSVILGNETGEGEFSCRTGGLIEKDFTILINFLVHETDVAVHLDGELQKQSLQRALLQANDLWKKAHPVDSDLHLEHPYHPTKTKTKIVPSHRKYGHHCSHPASPCIRSILGSSFSTSPFSAPPAGDMEGKIMWLQQLSWRLKHTEEQFMPLVNWRMKVNKNLEDFCSKVKDKKSLLQANQKARSNYSTIATTCRTRLCLASPQLSPRGAHALFSAYVTGAIENCGEIAKQHRKESGPFNRAWRHNHSRTDLMDILNGGKRDLEAIQSRLGGESSPTPSSPVTCSPTRRNGIPLTRTLSTEFTTFECEDVKQRSRSSPTNRHRAMSPTTPPIGCPSYITGQCGPQVNKHSPRREKGGDEYLVL